jgi:uncharacterized small protein (TIGR04563 family)
VSDKRKQSLYFTDEMIREMEIQAKRLDRSISWVIRSAWLVAKRHIEAIPAPRTDT